MQSLLDGLPPEIAKQVDPDCRRNEIGYWASRDELLVQYANQWIGFADGRVIACGRSPVEVLHAAKGLARHPFVTCVGREHEPCRMRRSAFPCGEDSSPRSARRARRIGTHKEASLFVSFMVANLAIWWGQRLPWG